MSNVLRNSCQLVLLFAAAHAWSQQSFQPIPLTGKAIYTIAPTTADPGLVTTENQDNIAIFPEGTPRPELFVWIPGSNGHPKGDSSMLATAATGGYRVIGLQYNDHGTAEHLCGETDDPECYTRLRQERFEGGMPDASAPNTSAEGIEHRLTMLLKYLTANHPDEGWGQYLDGDHPAWRKIVLAGHSQGAAMVAYIAKQHEVDRAVLFSGAADGVGHTAATRKWSTWLTEPSKTPMNRWYAEYNAKEQLAAVEPMVYVEMLKIPSSHVLEFKLDLPQNTPLVAHMSVVHDPRYLPCWKWMMGITDTKPTT
jgi:pimeloyl-ACP methyl ester carboxylesterase